MTSDIVLILFLGLGSVLGFVMFLFGYFNYNDGYGDTMIRTIRTSFYVGLTLFFFSLYSLIDVFILKQVYWRFMYG